MKDNFVSHASPHWLDLGNFRCKCPITESIWFCIWYIFREWKLRRSMSHSLDLFIY